jgi:hypothetical protein
MMKAEKAKKIPATTAEPSPEINVRRKIGLVIFV